MSTRKKPRSRRFTGEAKTRWHAGLDPRCAPIAKLMSSPRLVATEHGMRWQLTIEVSHQSYRLLQQLVETGLFGHSVAGVAEELLREQLRKVLAMGAHKMGANAK